MYFVNYATRNQFGKHLVFLAQMFLTVEYLSILA